MWHSDCLYVLHPRILSVCVCVCLAWDGGALRRRTRSSSDVYPTPPGLDGSLGPEAKIVCIQIVAHQQNTLLVGS